MILYLRVLEGPRHKNIFKIHDGITIGRSQSDINLQDPKASSVHGKILFREKEFIYCDQGSRNGTVFNGAQTERFSLRPGVVFYIGTTMLEVVSEFEVERVSKEALKEPWRAPLFSLLTHLNLGPAGGGDIRPFKKPISIQVLSGLDQGKAWCLGYGPRFLGYQSSDLTLLDPGFEDFVVKVFPAEEGDRVEYMGSSEASFNGEKKDSEILEGSLKINFRELLVEFRYVRGS